MQFQLHKGSQFYSARRLNDYNNLDMTWQESASETPWRPLRARGDMVRQMRRVVFDTKDEARRPSGQPAQPKEVQPGHIGYAAPMHRRAAFVESVDLQPAEIERVPRRPDDSGYS